MTTANTLTHVPAPPIHQPAPYEKWLAAQPAQYVGKHRGQPAAEPAPRTGQSMPVPALP